MTTHNDGRWRGVPPQAAPDDMALVTRKEAAEMIGTTTRTITRWADDGKLTKYLGVLGNVEFSEAEVKRLAARWTPPVKQVKPKLPGPMGHSVRRW